MNSPNLEQAFSNFFDEKFDKIFFALHKRYLSKSSSNADNWNEQSELRIVGQEQELNSEQVRDFVEEAFTRFYYKKLHTGEIEPAKWESYVYRIANNLVIDFFRKEKKTRKSVNSPAKARPSDKNLLLSVAEAVDMQVMKQFLAVSSDEELEQSGQKALSFLSNLVTFSIGFIPNQKHIASLLLQDENYEHVSFSEAKERLNTRSVSEWYTRGKQAVISQITHALNDRLEDWVVAGKKTAYEQEWKTLKELLNIGDYALGQLEAQFKQVFGQEVEEVFRDKAQTTQPSMYELLILFNEKKYAHRKLFFKAQKHKVDTTNAQSLKRTLNKQLKLPIDLVRRFFNRQLGLIHSAIQVYLLADCLKKKEINEMEG